MIPMSEELTSSANISVRGKHQVVIISTLRLQILDSGLVRVGSLCACHSMRCHSRSDAIHRQLFRAAHINMAIGDGWNRELDRSPRRVTCGDLAAVIVQR